MNDSPADRNRAAIYLRVSKAEMKRRTGLAYGTVSKYVERIGNGTGESG